MKPRRPFVHRPSSIVNPKVAVVLAAGGAGARIGGWLPKQFLSLAGKPILLRTLERIASLDDVVQVVIALPASHIRRAKEMLGSSWRFPVKYTRGGPTRQESVRRGVAQVSPEPDLIMVHDGVRPLCDLETMRRVIEAAAQDGGAVAGLPATETIQRVSRRGLVIATPPREQLYAIQTPQVFAAGILRRALESAARTGFAGTDESSVVRWAGHRVRVVPGSPANIKITHPLDLRVAEILISGVSDQNPGRLSRERTGPMRIGHGMDYHRLVIGRKLVLGGVEIPFEKGLEGHSDADVLSHAVCDALLGAAGLGDIGQHFPDDAAANRNRSSLEFLCEVRRRIEEAGWSIQNVDATLLAERPKLAPCRETMRCNVAEALSISVEQVNVKAKTSEGMNAEGRGEGISAQAVALLQAKGSKGAKGRRGKGVKGGKRVNG